MGLCHSSALKVTVFTSEGQKQEYQFSMKKMKTFKTLGDVFNLVGIDLSATDKIYYQNHVKLVEVYTYSPFQIRDFVIKSNQKDAKYRIMMDQLY
jgi:hypothetical protein